MLKKISAAVIGLLLVATAVWAGSTINPTVPAANSPMASAPIRNNFAAAYADINKILNKYSGITAPVNPTTYQWWIDTSTLPYPIKIYDGAQWLSLGTINPTTHVLSISGSLSPPTPSTLGGVFSKAPVANQFFTGLDTTGTFSAAQPTFSNIGGAVAASQLPNPTDSTLGGVRSLAPVASQFLTGISTLGQPTQAQPAFTDISGSVAAAQLPNPSASTLGGVRSLAAVSSNFLTSISTSGQPTQAQPAASDLSNGTSGSGTVVLATSPTLVTPTLGVATATSVNKVAITAPATSATLTVADGKTLTANSSLTLAGTDSKTLTVSNSLTLAGTDGTTLTGPGVSATIAALNIEDQTLAGGANVTAKSLSTGNITVDCGARPLQFITNGGAYTITAPANDGSCIVLSTNNGSAGTISFSGFSVGSNTGDALTTTNTSKFMIQIVRINGSSTYSIKALQ